VVRLVAEAATYTTHNKHEKRTFIALGNQRLQAYALHRAATGIGG
jgi:hypothetical protein